MSGKGEFLGFGSTTIKQYPVKKSPTLFAFLLLVSGAIRVAEYVMLLLTVNAFVIFLCHRHRWLVTRRVFFCAALSYLFRAFCITIIQVPVPSVHTYCAPKETGGFSLVSARVVRIFWSAGIEQLRPRELCGDLVVSGHTLTIITSLFAFKQYAPRRLQILGHIYTVLAAGALFAILLSRKHYSLDVLLGYMVASRMFMEYHAVATAFHEGQVERNPLWGCLWSRLVPYLERDAPPPHLFVNQLEWPSTCFSKLRRCYAT